MLEKLKKIDWLLVLFCVMPFYFTALMIAGISGVTR